MEDKYELNSASWIPRTPRLVGVAFHPRLHPSYGDVGRWDLVLVDLETGQRQTFKPERIHSDGVSPELNLEFSRDLMLWDETGSHHDAYVGFLGADYQEVRVGRPGKKPEPRGGLTRATKKSDAAIYLSGLYATAKDGKPTYAAEIILKHLWRLRGGRGELGGEFTMESAEERNIDPDKMTLGLAYENLIGFGDSPTALLLSARPVQVEVARKDDTRNVDASVLATLVLESIRLGERAFLAFEPLGGFEAGRNVSTGDDGTERYSIFRPMAGINVYLLAFGRPAGFDRTALTVQYVVRLPRTDEPFSEVTDGTEVRTLTGKARHHIAADLTLQVTKLFGITAKYQYGSLPPSFKKVDHKGSVGFVFQAKHR